MICPIMSKVVTSPEFTNDGHSTGGVRHDLFPVDCAEKDCALWNKVKKICGLTNK